MLIKKLLKLYPSYFILAQIGKIIKGEELGISEMNATALRGIEGESNLYNVIRSEFEYNCTNKFTDPKRTYELDCIIFYNGHIIGIEAKNYTGAVYIDPKTEEWIRVPDLFNYEHGKTRGAIHRKLNRAAKKLGDYLQKQTGIGKVWVDKVICISDQCDISSINEEKYPVCKVSELNQYIKRTFSKKGDYDIDIWPILEGLPEWDMVANGEITANAIVESKQIKLLNMFLGKETIHLTECKRISVNESLFPTNPYHIRIEFKNGKIRNFLTYKEKISYWNGSDSLVNLGKLNTIKFGT